MARVFPVIERPYHLEGNGHDPHNLRGIRGASRGSLEEAQRTFVEMLDAAVGHKTERVLFDGRELKGDPGTIQRFLYGEFAAHTVAEYAREHGLRRGPQFAYILLEPVLDPQRFGETVAVNRGMWVKAFDNLEDALEWLGLEAELEA